MYTRAPATNQWLPVQAGARAVTRVQQYALQNWCAGRSSAGYTDRTPHQQQLETEKVLLLLVKAGGV